ncbi:MAG: GHKL domain-containing protein [Lachnospiraceae bacterium]|nr:GHKL domain-containing protein [Lachnospiraceae bacterium]
MFAYIESALIIVLEVLCCKIFYGAFGNKRKKENEWIEHILILLLIVEFFCSALFFEQMVLLKVLMVVAGIAIVMYCIMEISFVKTLIMAFLYEGLMFVVDYLTFLLCVTVFKNVAKIDNIYYIQGGLLVLLDKVFLFLIVLVIRKAVGDYEIQIMKDSDWVKFIFFPIYTICTIAGMIFVLGAPNPQNKDIIFFMIAFGLVGMNIVVFYLISDIMKRENEIYEDKIFRLQMKNQTEMYYSISENLEKQRRKSHEYKNQLVCIKSLLKRNKIKEVNSYINQIGDVLETESDNISTNHVIVDAILNTKYGEMMEKNIIFVFRINDLSQLTVSDEDIVVILSNLLNNAIEACEKCHEKKVVKLKFIIEKNVTIISVKNTYENALVKHDGMFLTTKNEQDEHGIGICNITNVIEKYGGSYVIKPDNGEFYFSIIIPQNRKGVAALSDMPPSR